MYDVAVIGCGIVGAATACELSKYRLRVVVLERENDVAAGTTKANSAIIHAGFDPEPGTKMAALSVEGARLTKELCEALDVPYRQPGSLVVAFSPEDERMLQTLYRRGVKNGVPGLEVLGRERLLEREPNLSREAVGALYAPTAGIVSPWELALALVETAVRNGVELFRSCAVTGIHTEGDGFALGTSQGMFTARYIFNAAGVDADTVHNLIAEPAFHIKPNRGEYYLLDKAEGERVRHVIFPCPGPQGKGVLVSPTVHGNLIVGPNAQDVEDAEDTATTRGGLAEVVEKSRKSVPSIDLRQSIRNFAGLRAATEIDDFIIAETADVPGFFDLAGIKSPGLSAAPAIARAAVGMLGKKLPLVKREEFIGTRRRIRFQELTQGEKAALVKENPAFGRVVCRCEGITEGEILECLGTPVPPVSLDGVKRRCNPGMGRCQGGFCGPRVLEILSREREERPEAIPQDKEGSRIIAGRTKEAVHNV